MSRALTIESPTDEPILVTLFRAVLSELGEDPRRPGLVETPARAAKAWKDWTDGYHQDPKALLKVFDEDSQVDEMVVMRNIEFYSHCEHHLAPFFGTMHIGYIPAPGKVVGLSKLARVADVFAKRLQVQERLTNEIADCLMEGLEPLGVGVVVEAKHFCVCSRGVGKQHSTTSTSALRGAFREKSEVRAEFLALARST
jgi:GTP cyclohydrolase I